MQIMNSSKCLWTAATMLLFGRHCQGLAMLHPMSGKHNAESLLGEITSRQMLDEIAQALREGN